MATSLDKTASAGKESEKTDEKARPHELSPNGDLFGGVEGLIDPADYDFTASSEPIADRLPRSKKRQIQIESLTQQEMREGKFRLKSLCEDAFRTLSEAMAYAEHATSVSAAKAVLDRSGFGPTKTLVIEEDLSEIPDEVLAARVEKLARRLRQSSDDGVGNPADRNRPEVKPDAIH